MKEKLREGLEGSVSVTQEGPRVCWGVDGENTLKREPTVLRKEDEKEVTCQSGSPCGRHKIIRDTGTLDRVSDLKSSKNRLQTSYFLFRKV